VKHKFTVGIVLAIMMVFAVTVTAFAAGPGPNAAADPGAGMAGQGAALHGDFIDITGKQGICDNYEVRDQAQDGTGNMWGNGGNAGMHGEQANFVDEDGDGECDNGLGDGTHPQDGTGYRQGNDGKGAQGDETGQQKGQGRGRWNR